MALKSALMNVMQQAARRAARDLVRDFGEVENLQVSRKGPGDFVTIADKRTDEQLREHLHKARPDFGFLTEEGPSQVGNDASRRWIIDPLDGTTNFLHGIPHFAISIAAEEAGKITAAVIYQPVSDELYWAESGGGAYLNDRRLRVSGRRDLAAAVIATGSPNIGDSETKHATFNRELRAVMSQTTAVRRFGAASLDLAFVAAGRYDGFWQRGLMPWDVAAGILLVRESGGFSTTPEGRDNAMGKGDILAANAELHGRMLRLMRDVRRAAQ